jgi:hypothetical protein
MAGNSSMQELPSKWESALPILLFGTEGKKYSFNFSRMPLSTPTGVVTVLVAYLGTLALLSALRSGRPGMPLRGLAFVHNLVLAIGSAVLLACIASEVIPSLLQDGLFMSICGTNIFNGRLEALYYINYLFKVWELFDTILLVLKGHRLTFLHVYHHCLTFVLCYTQFVGQSTVQWVPITLNLIVHAFMYWYYAVSSLGIQPWWKKYLTTLQIIQFIVDIGFCYYCIAVLSAFENGLIDMGCHGSKTAAWFGSLLLTSYLYLFIDFFRNTYGPKTGTKPTKVKQH